MEQALEKVQPKIKTQTATNTNPYTRAPVVWTLALIASVLWGSATPCIKIGYELFQIPAADTASVILFAGYRFTLAGLFVILFGSLKNRKLMVPKKAALPTIAKLSLFQTVLQYSFLYIGLANTSGVKCSIISASNVFVAILLSCLLFHYEKFTSKKIIGCIIGFLGVVVINLDPAGLSTPFRFTGEGLIFLSAASAATSSNLMKTFSQKEDTVLLSGYQFLFGGLFILLLGKLMGGHVTNFTPVSTTLLLYLGFLSAVAYSLWSLLLKHNPVGKVTIFGFLYPVFGVILSGLVLHESSQAFGLQGICALILVSIGILTVNRVKA